MVIPRAELQLLLRDDALRVRDRVQAVDGECRLTIYDDVPHGWHFFARMMPEARAALQEVADFVRGHFTLPSDHQPADDWPGRDIFAIG